MKKNQMESLELKTTNLGEKKILDELNRRLELQKEREESSHHKNRRKQV